VEAADLARAIGCTLVRQLGGGEGEGAYEVRAADDTRAVLKFTRGGHLDFERAAVVTAALRARDYPAPATLATGTVDGVRYGLTELMPGSPLPELTAAFLPRVIDLVDRQQAVGLPGRAPWVLDMVTSVVDGRAGYCEHAAMQSYSSETAAFLDRLRTIAAAHADVDVASDDVVHTDFHTRNMVAVGDEVTGVFDWEGATSGDRTFDLVTQALYAPNFRAALLEAAAHRTDPRALELYAAHMALRQVDWSIRHHGPAEVRWALDQGNALLAETLV
jgi:aminoglycoside phosphotransferase